MADGERERYRVMVDDNFHYMDETKRYQYGSYATAAEAISVCRQIVDRSLGMPGKPGMTPDELYERYKLFGEDPFVLAPEGAERVVFSARKYARHRAELLCAST